MKILPSLASLLFLFPVVFLTPLPAQLSDPFADDEPPRPSPDPFIRDEARPGARPHPAGQGQQNLLFLTEFIEVDPLILSDLLQGGEVDLSDGKAVRDIVDAWLQNDQGHLVDWSLHLGRSHRSRAEAIAEIIYPVEWDPGEGLPLYQSSTAGPLQTKERSPIPMMVDDVAYWPPASWPHPTTFEVRPAGLSTDVSILLSVERDSEPQISAAPELVLHRGATSAFHAAGPGVRVAAPSVPTFEWWRATSEAAPLSEHGVHWLGTSQSSEGPLMMLFLTAFHPSPPPSPKHPEPIRNVRAVAELIEVDKAWIEALISPVAGHPWDAGELRNQLREPLQTEDASVLGILSASAPLGIVGRAQANRERIYATEYRPATLPGYEVPEGADLRFWSPDSYPSPSAYQTRNLGITLEFTASDRGDPSGLELDLSFEYVEHLEDRVAHAFSTPRGVEPLCTMPTFSTIRVTTQVAARPGEVLLLGALARRLPNGEPVADKQVLMFLRLTP